MKYACGCVIEPDPVSGVLRSAAKCRRHRIGSRRPGSLDEAYYADLGVLGDVPHVGQLTEALGPLPPATGNRLALEVGCGCSSYVGAIQAAGWSYLGLDASPWAARWTAQRWNCTTAVSDWDAWPSLGRYGLILAAHVLEHLPDAPGAIDRMAGLLGPSGELWVVVPDDSDPFNPDHLWYWTAGTLRARVVSAGLTVLALETRRYIKRENFLYLRAVKNAADRSGIG